MNIDRIFSFCYPFQVVIYFQKITSNYQSCWGEFIMNLVWYFNPFLFIFIHTHTSLHLCDYCIGWVVGSPTFVPWYQRLMGRCTPPPPPWDEKNGMNSKGLWGIILTGNFVFSVFPNVYIVLWDDGYTNNYKGFKLYYMVERPPLPVLLP